MQAESEAGPPRWIARREIFALCVALLALILSLRAGGGNEQESVAGPAVKPLTAVVALRPGETKEEMCDGLRVPPRLCSISTIRADGAVELRLELERPPSPIE